MLLTTTINSLPSSRAGDTSWSPASCTSDALVTWWDIDVCKTSWAINTLSYALSRRGRRPRRQRRGPPRACPGLRPSSVWQNVCNKSIDPDSLFGRRNGRKQIPDCSCTYQSSYLHVALIVSAHIQQYICSYTLWIRTFYVQNTYETQTEIRTNIRAYTNIREYVQIRMQKIRAKIRATMAWMYLHVVVHIYVQIRTWKCTDGFNSLMLLQIN